MKLFDKIADWLFEFRFELIIVLFVGFTVAVTLTYHPKPKPPTTICLDGVAYWAVPTISGRSVAPKIDPQTLSFKLCE